MEIGEERITPHKQLLDAIALKEHLRSLTPTVNRIGRRFRYHDGVPHGIIAAAQTTEHKVGAVLQQREVLDDVALV